MLKPTPLRQDGLEVPLTDRLDATNPKSALVVHRHNEAVASGRDTYWDPITGMSVFTSHFLARRGYCCESGCRHCPFEQD